MKKAAVPFHSGKFQSFDGTSIYYEVRGKGEPIVFVYGLACLINHWHFQIEHFSHSHQVVAFDVRAHHKSGRPENPDNLSLEAIAKDIPYLFRELGIRKAHFVGHSFGAQSMLKTYELSPELFSSMIFINGFAKNPIKGMFGLDIVEPFFKFVKTNYDRNPQFFDSVWKKVVENPLSILGSGLAGGFNLSVTQLKDIEIYARGVASMSLSVFMPYFENMMRFDGERVASSVKVPTLIISGERDMVTPLKFQEDLHALIKGSDFVRVPYGSHCTQLDFPDYINLKIEQFLSKTEKK
jgi:pimeloyl-ACP methyl ester carboxylesterase